MSKNIKISKSIYEALQYINTMFAFHRLLLLCICNLCRATFTDLRNL